MNRQDLQHWEHEFEGRLSAPVVAGDAAYASVTSGDPSGVVAVDAATGVRRWFQAGVVPADADAESGPPPGTPVPGRGLVYVAESADSDGSVAALDVEDGEWVWRGGDDADPRRPVADEDVVVAAYGGDRASVPGAVGLDPRSGEQSWTYTDFGGKALGRVGDTTILGGSNTYGIEMSSGLLFSGMDDAWSFHLEGSFRGMATDGRSVYLADFALKRSNSVYALDPGRLEGYVDPEDGDHRWQYVRESAADLWAAGGSVFLLQNHTTELALVALDPGDGTERWRTPGEVTTVPPVVVAEETAYVGTDSGVVLALDRTDGSVRWRLQVGPDAPVRPAVAGDTLVVANQLGTMVAVDRSAVPGTDEHRVVTDAGARPTKAVVRELERAGDVDALVEATRSEGVEARWLALRSLNSLAAEDVELGDAVAEAAVDRLDDDSRLRATAASLVARLADRGVTAEGALEPLNDAARSDPEARAAALVAIEALAAAGVASEDSLEILEGLTDSPETQSFAPRAAFDPPAVGTGQADFGKASVAVLDRDLDANGDQASGVEDVRAADDAIDEWLDRLVLADVDVVVARGPVEPTVAEYLAGEGVVALGDAGVVGVADAVRASGGELLANPDELTEAALGSAPASVEDVDGQEMVVVGEQFPGSSSDSDGTPGSREVPIADEAERVLGRVRECLEETGSND